MNVKLLFLNRYAATVAVLCFVIGFVIYDVSVITKETAMMLGDNWDGEKEPCTFGLFRRIQKAEGYFPTGGKWVGSGEEARYQPDACYFRYPEASEFYVDRCLTSGKITSILTTGDSTGSCYFHALRKQLRTNCQTVKSERLEEGGFLPDKSYFTDNLTPNVSQHVRVHIRFCKGCTSQLQSCSLYSSTGSYNFSLEHIAQTLILDDSIQIEFTSSRKGTLCMEDIWALTTQEFIFRYYLKDRYPDVFLIFLPFAHAKLNLVLDRLESELRYFKSLADIYLPKSTKLIYFPFYSEIEAARLEKKNWSYRRFQGLLASEKIDLMNRILYRVLERDLLDPESNTYGFLDLFEASLTRGNWSVDGVHMQPIWYQNVMDMFLETFCNSVLLNDF